MNFQKNFWKKILFLKNKIIILTILILIKILKVTKIIEVQGGFAIKKELNDKAANR